MGVFPSFRGGDCIITNISTSLSLWRRQCGHSLTPFVQVGTYPTRNFGYLRTVIVTAAVLLGLQSRACTPSFNLPAPGRSHTPIRRLSSLQSAVFLINSCSHRFSAASLGLPSKWAHLLKAHLLPKLRCQFAEFLLQSSLKRLRILISRTQCRFCGTVVNS